MGDHQVNTEINKETRSAFIRQLLDDIQALERMLDNDLIESNITRIGAEQELCLVNEFWRPANNSIDLLEKIKDKHFTTELAKYNLEINLDPFDFHTDALSKIEKQLIDLITKARHIAKEENTRIILTGILPTISMNELAVDYITPNPRYWMMNKLLKEMRGSDFELQINGVDELSIKHDSVLFEACNTSFQMHLQVSPEDFVSSYNWSQAISAPVLGVSTNSPVLLGRELWSETRIALFRQSIDLHNSSYALKSNKPRVTFGNKWAKGTVADFFKNNIVDYEVILAKDTEKNALEELEKGNIPKLEALNLHNSTVYLWNRPCYGVGGGKPHIRIENRYIPSGPTIIDEMANFAFWTGLMMGRPKEFDNMPEVMDFRDARSNFIKAAQHGKESIMKWKGELISVRDLVVEQLLPIAHEGLKKCNIDEADRHRLLDVIEKRAKSVTGSQWIKRRYRKLCTELKQDDALLALTKAMYKNQAHNKPIHEWPDLESTPETHEAAHQLRHIMSTQLYTANENDLAELATNIMKWKNVHHVPIENNAGEISGLLTWTHMERFEEKHGKNENMIVKEIMATDLHLGAPEMEISEAIKIMKEREIGCMPVVKNNQVVGMVTIGDVLPFDND